MWQSAGFLYSRSAIPQLSQGLSAWKIAVQQEFVDACEKAIDERNRVNSAKDQTRIGNDSISAEKKDKLKEAIQRKIDSGTVDVVKTNKWLE